MSRTAIIECCSSIGKVRVESFKNAEHVRDNRCLVMKLNVLVSPGLMAVLWELGWGDRFLRDLEVAYASKKKKQEGSFESLVEALVTGGLVYKLKGEKGSPYLSLTYMGQAVLDHLRQIEVIMGADD
ncbi:MAG: hypothetical protein ACW99U_15530 [Candidatus Thorarchaeota archaeon]|jgi:hypothetical protein